MSFERPDIIRPPSEHDSYFLPLTSGCSNNTCAFCGFYGSKLKVRDLAEIKQEIDALLLYMRNRVRLPGISNIVYTIANQWNGRKVFLQDGDALVYPYQSLKEALGHLNQKFPSLERISSYATPQDILRRNLTELKELKTLKLGILYMGLESGDPDILRQIGKGATPEEMVEAGRKVKESGILLSVTVILGLGGVLKREEHIHNTARVLTGIDPDYAGALTLMPVPGTPLGKAVLGGDFQLPTPFESLQELRGLIAESNFTNCFFSSMHASNYLAVRARLPAEKEVTLRKLDAVISSGDGSILRPEIMRGL